MAAPQKECFIDMYLAYTKDTEASTLIHRWTAISVVATALNRQFWLRHGHFFVYPNLYVMLIGESGSRKTTAIKMSRPILTAAGLGGIIAATKTSKEKYLLDLAGEADDGTVEDWVLSEDSVELRESYIMADEFVDFTGAQNLEFYSMLGVLWDFNGVYEHRLKNSRCISIPNPTINILSGNNLVGLQMGFPVEAIGQGFLSRTIFVYAETTGRKITWPEEPEPAMKMSLIKKLTDIRLSIRGQVELEPSARELLHKIYQGWEPLNDLRFASYSNRRLTQLLKLCLIVAASRESCTISHSDVIYANTILTFTELQMPRALGEFGKSKLSDCGSKIMEILYNATKPITVTELWKKGLSRDLDSIQDLTKVLEGLKQGDKIQIIPNKGILAKKEIIGDGRIRYVDWSLLQEARGGLWNS